MAPIGSSDSAGMPYRGWHRPPDTPPNNRIRSRPSRFRSSCWVACDQQRLSCVYGPRMHVSALRCIAVLGLAGALVGCSGSSKSSVAPCTLLTVDQISTSVGYPVTSGAAITSDADGAHGCQYGVILPDGSRNADVEIWLGGHASTTFESMKAGAGTAVVGTRNPTYSMTIDRVPATDSAVSQRGDDYVAVIAYSHNGAAGRIADLAATNLP